MANIKEKGTIAIMGEVQSGTSQNGNAWARQQIVVDVEGYNGTYRKVALQASTNGVRDLESMQVGDKVEITYQVTAREWQGKWYNNVDLLRIEMIEETVAAQMGYTTPAIPLPPHENPQYQPQVNPQMYQHPVAPATPRRRRVQSQPLIPQNANLAPQPEDMPF